MASLNLTTADEILKINYEGPIREQLENENVLLAHIKKSTDKSTFRGRQTLIPIHTGRNIGRGSRAEGETLPLAGAQKHENAIYNMSYFYGRIELTGQAIAVSKDNAGAFARVIEMEMSGLKTDLQRDLNRQLWHDGSGRLCDCTAKTSTLDQYVPVTNNKFCEVGQVVDLRDMNVGTGVATSAGGVATSRTIASVASDGLSITLAALASADSDVPNITTNQSVYLSGARLGGNWNKPVEFWGLEAIVNDTNPGQSRYENGSFSTGGANDNQWTSQASTQLGELDCTDASLSSWNANVSTSGTWGDNFDDMQQAYDESEIEGGGHPGLILTSYPMRREFGKLLTDQRRFGNETELKSGWTAIQFNNSTILCDRDASWTWNPKNSDTVDHATLGGFNGMYFLQPKSLEWHVLEDLKWEDTGGVLVRNSVGATATDQFDAYMKMYANLICTRRNANSLLVGDPSP